MKVGPIRAAPRHPEATSRSSCCVALCAGLLVGFGIAWLATGGRGLEQRLRIGALAGSAVGGGLIFIALDSCRQRRTAHGPTLSTLTWPPGPPMPPETRVERTIPIQFWGRTYHLNPVLAYRSELLAGALSATPRGALRLTDRCTHESIELAIEYLHRYQLPSNLTVKMATDALHTAHELRIPCLQARLEEHLSRALTAENRDEIQTQAVITASHVLLRQIAAFDHLAIPEARRSEEAAESYRPIPVEAPRGPFAYMMSHANTMTPLDIWSTSRFHREVLLLAGRMPGSILPDGTAVAADIYSQEEVGALCWYLYRGVVPAAAVANRLIACLQGSPLQQELLRALGFTCLEDYQLAHQAVPLVQTVTDIPEESARTLSCSRLGREDTAILAANRRPELRALGLVNCTLSLLDLRRLLANCPYVDNLRLSHCTLQGADGRAITAAEFTSALAPLRQLRLLMTDWPVQWARLAITTPHLSGLALSGEAAASLPDARAQRRWGLGDPVRVPATGEIRYARAATPPPAPASGVPPRTAPAVARR